MALDRYKSTGTLLPAGEMTTVVSQQAFSDSQNLERRLDKLSSVIYEELKQDAITKGQQYAVKNSPSLKQIYDAVENKQDVNALFAKEGSYYGDAARAVQADYLRQDSVATFLSKTELIKKQLENRTLSFDDADAIANTLQAEINGTYDVIAQISPDAALKFNAQTNKLGYDVYATANELALEYSYQEKVAKINGFTTDGLNLFEKKLGEGDPVTAIVWMKDIRNDIIASYGMLKDGSGVAKIEEFREKENKIIAKVITEKLGALIDLDEGPSALLDKLHSGTLENSYADLYQDSTIVTEQMKDDIDDAIAKYVEEQRKIQTDTNTFREKKIAQETSALEDEYIYGEPTEERKVEIKGKLREYVKQSSNYKYSNITALDEANTKINDASILNSLRGRQLRDDILEGKITTPDALTVAARKIITADYPEGIPEDIAFRIFGNLLENKKMQSIIRNVDAVTTMISGPEDTQLDKNKKRVLMNDKIRTKIQANEKYNRENQDQLNFQPRTTDANEISREIINDETVKMRKEEYETLLNGYIADLKILFQPLEDQSLLNYVDSMGTDINTLENNLYPDSTFITNLFERIGKSKVKSSLRTFTTRLNEIKAKRKEYEEALANVR